MILTDSPSSDLSKHLDSFSEIMIIVHNLPPQTASVPLEAYFQMGSVFDKEKYAGSTFLGTLTCANPSSQPLITSFRPIVNLKGLFLSREESNFFPFCSVPAINNRSTKSWLKNKHF